MQGRTGTAALMALFISSMLLASAPPPSIYSSPIILITNNLALASLTGPYGSATSTDWSGYVVTAAAGSVTDVKGSWKVPPIQGACTATNTYSLTWVGIDGYTSSTVEQAGTASNCASGHPQYYAWYEAYPKPLSRITGVPVNPGDIISAEVKYSASKFTATVSDVTSGKSYTTSFTANGASRSSAEWITEAPTSTGTTVLPLADFGTAYLGNDYTSVASTGYATVAGNTGSIGSFSSPVQVTMATSTGVVKAQPSALTSDGTSFSIAWKSQ